MKQSILESANIVHAPPPRRYFHVPTTITTARPLGSAVPKGPPPTRSTMIGSATPANMVGAGPMMKATGPRLRRMTIKRASAITAAPKVRRGY